MKQKRNLSSWILNEKNKNKIQMVENELAFEYASSACVILCTWKEDKRNTQHRIFVFGINLFLYLSLSRFILLLEFSHLVCHSRLWTGFVYINMNRESDSA